MAKTDKLGNESYGSFMCYYQKVWDRYKRYGNSVIEDEFEEGEEEVKNIFLESKDEKKFKEALTALWREKYQIIINSCEDIEKAYNNNVELIYLLEEKNLKTMDKFYVSVEFFEKLMKKRISKTKSYIYINDCVYEIELIRTGYKRITINNKIPIASMLKDE